MAEWCLPGRLAYVVDHSYPQTSDGYAVRTHAVARALGAAGHEVIVINRPGRPWDIEGFAPEGPVPAEQQIDGVRYVFPPLPALPGANRRARLRQAERVLMEVFGIYRPGAVLAVSNWENAEPAQYAARRWKLPFFYEQRGFWELTRAASEPAYAQSADYAATRASELRIAEAAQAVFTLNRAMRDELVRRGVAAGKIHLMPNGVSTPGRIPRDVTRAGLGITARHLLGYVGSLGAYEGAEDLIPTLAALRGRGVDAALLIVGSSVPKGLIGSRHATAAEARLRAAAEAEGLGAFVHFVPQVPEARIGAYYALLDAVLVPRRRTVVTDLVAPLKPYAAASYGVPVFMTDMPPLDEIAADIHASLFPEGDTERLAAMLAETLTRGGHPAVLNPLKPGIHWARRIAPLLRVLEAARQSHPTLPEMLRLAPAAGAPAAEAEPAPAAPSGFDTHVLPRVALGAMGGAERVLAIGPAAHLRGAGVSRASRVSLLADLATGAPGRLVIDWRGLEAAAAAGEETGEGAGEGPGAGPGEWAGLWSIDSMRLNRQVMDACRIARDRGWRIEVIGPVARSRAPLFRTVAGVVEEVRPETEEAGQPAAGEAGR